LACDCQDEKAQQVLTALKLVHTGDTDLVRVGGMNKLLHDSQVWRNWTNSTMMHF